MLTKHSPLRDVVCRGFTAMCLGRGKWHIVVYNNIAGNVWEFWGIPKRIINGKHFWGGNWACLSPSLCLNKSKILKTL